MKRLGSRTTRWAFWCGIGILVFAVVVVLGVGFGMFFGVVVGSLVVAGRIPFDVVAAVADCRVFEVKGIVDSDLVLGYCSLEVVVGIVGAVKAECLSAIQIDCLNSLAVGLELVGIVLVEEESNLGVAGYSAVDNLVMPRTILHLESAAAVLDEDLVIQEVEALERISFLLVGK
jgi:hypothetical protein